MASAGAVAAPLPGGNGIYLSPNLTVVNCEQELLAKKMAKSGFISPYLGATLSAVFGQGFEVNLYRDRKPPDNEDGSSSVIDSEALKKSKLKPTGSDPPAAAGGPTKKAKKAPPEADDGDKEMRDNNFEEEDRQAPGVNQPTPFGKGPKEAEGIGPTKRPPMSKFPQPPSPDESEKIPLSKEERKNIETNWKLSGEEFFKECLTVGGAVVRIYTDRHTKRKCFSFVPTKDRIIFYRQNTVSNVKRDYFVAFLDRRAGTVKITGDGKVTPITEDALASGGLSLDPNADGSPGTADKPQLLLEPAVVVQDNESNRGVPTMEGGITNLIFYLFEPDDEGNITSPVFRSSEAATGMEITRYTEIHANLMRSQPMHVISTGPKQQGIGGVTTGREVLTPGRYTQGDMFGQRNAFSYTSTKDERAKFDLAAFLSRSQGGATVGAKKVEAIIQHERLIANSGEWSFATPRLSSLSNMFDLRPVPPIQANSIVLPPGQVMGGGPQAENAGNYAPQQESLKSEMSGIWEMPIQMLDMSGTKYASDAGLVDKRWEAKKIHYWTRLSAFLSTIWSAAHASEAQTFTKMIRKALKDESDTIKGGGGTTYSVDLKAEKDRLLQTPEARQLNSVLSEAASKRKRSEAEAIRKTLRVEVSFNVSLAGGDPAIVQTLHQMDGIDTNTAIAIYGELGGVPRNLLLLTEEARVQQRQNRLQVETDTMYANTMPPPPGPPGEGKPPAPKQFKQKAPPKPAFDTKK